MPIASVKVAISAGELSGDQHAAKLVKAIRLQNDHTEFQFIGMGGRSLAAEGVSISVDSEKSGAINGFNLFKIFSSGLFSLLRMCLLIYREKPDLLILVDYPDFNLRLAKFAKLFGIKTIFFIPPKLWAWRKSRIKLFKQYIDQTLTIFPFETEFFQANGYDNVSFVGHPFTSQLEDIIDPNKTREAFLRPMGLVPSYPTIAVFPGSRKSEVKRHCRTIMSALKKLKTEVPELQAIIAIAPSIKPAMVKKLTGNVDWIKFNQNNSLEVLNYCDAGILKSGTCNLEAAYLNLPFVCFYQTSRLTAWLVRKYVELKEYSLVNIIKPNTIKEFIQEDATAENIAAETMKLIYDSKARQQVLEDFSQIRTDLNPNKQKSSAYVEAAKAIDIQPRNERKPKAIRRLFSTLKTYRKEFTLAIIAMVIFGATDGALPFIIKEFLDGVFSSQNKSMLYALPAILIVLALVRAFSGFYQEFMMAKIGHNIVKDFRNKLHNHLLVLNPDYYSQNSSGNLLARFTSDVLLVRNFLTSSTAAIIRDSIRVIALLGAAIYLDPTLAMIAFVALPIGIFPVYNFGRRIRKLSKKGQQEIGSISAFIQETVSGNRVIKLFNQEQSEQDKFEENNSNLTKTFVKSEKISALSNPVNELLAVMAICGVVLYGGHSVINGTRTQGDFIAFLLAVFLMYDPFKKLSKVYHHMQQGASGAERIYEVLDQEPSIKEVAEPKPFPSDYTIRFNDVNFAYPNSNAVVLENINLTVKPNQKLALVGFSGSGKSTLVDLLPRFIDPIAGTVTIGGIDLKDLRLKEIRDCLLYTSPSPRDKRQSRMPSSA